MRRPSSDPRSSQGQDVDRPAIRDLVAEHGGLVFGPGALETRAILPSDARFDAAITDVHVRSGSVHPGELFAALPGLRVDGVRFVPDAAGRGASLILLPAERSLDTVRAAVRRADSEALVWVHPRPKAVLAGISAQVHGFPSSSLDVAAVTGTNGKTSVCHLAAQLLRAAGRLPAVLGTAGHSLAGPAGPLLLEASHTTPDATGVQRLLRRHLDGGGDSAVMEASSHALTQGRLNGTRVRVGAFTNLTREHLDYHRTMEAYARAKAKLFDTVEDGGDAVIFGDSDVSRDMAARARGRGLRVVTAAIQSKADLVAKSLEFSVRGASFDLFGLGFKGQRVILPLRGQHNVENALVAAAVASSLGATVDEIQGGLESAVAAPGRLESVPIPPKLAAEGRFDVVVDYAHSPDALERVLSALRQDLESVDSARAASHDGSAGGTGGAKRGRLICVFGCGGDRDQGKREPMGRAAGRIADVSIVTSDNPRGEDPGEIASAVTRGVDAVDGRRIVELDRAAAIERAVELARPSDVILIAGKGHENTQVAMGRSVAFDDRVVAMEALRTRAARAAGSQA